jgi:hypothetical protein
MPGEIGATLQRRLDPIVAKRQKDKIKDDKRASRSTRVSSTRADAEGPAVSFALCAFQHSIMKYSKNRSSPRTS